MESDVAKVVFQFLLELMKCESCRSVTKSGDKFFIQTN